MKKRLIGFDVLRVFALTVIFVAHFAMEYSLTGNGTDPMVFKINYLFNSAGRTVNILLFMISGYALMYNHEENIPVKDFYIKRFKGLYIPFYIAYTIMYLLSFMLTNVAVGSVYPGYKFIFTILGIDGFTQMIAPNYYLVGEWFMASMVFCYLVFPALAKALDKVKYIALAVLFIWYILLLFIYNPFSFTQMMNPLFVVFYFYLGMLLYKLFGNENITKKFRVIAGVVSVVIFVYFMLVGNIHELRVYEPSEEINEIISFIWAVALFIYARDAQIKEGSRLYRTIAYISSISWFVILVHHRIIILLYTHYSIELYSRRETFSMFLLAFALTWIGAVVVRELTGKVKKAITK